MLNKKRAKTLINFCIMPGINKCKEIFGEIEKSNKIYSTVDLDYDLEKISRKLKFGRDVPYTFRIHQKKKKKSPPIAPWEWPKSIITDLQLFFFILI